MAVGYLPHGFDLFNVGHLSLVDQIKQRCAKLVVGVLTDEEMTRRYGRPPVVPLSERVDILQHVRGIDEVIIHDDDVMNRLGPDHIVFVVADGALGDWPIDSVIIEPLRSTDSEILKIALSAAPERAVA